MSCWRYLRPAAILLTKLSVCFLNYFHRCLNPLSAALTSKTIVDGSVAQYVPNLNAGRRSVVNFLHQLLNHRSRASGRWWIEGCVGYRGGLNVMEKGKHMSARRFVWLSGIRFVKYPLISSSWFFFHTNTKHIAQEMKQPANTGWCSNQFALASLCSGEHPVTAFL
jgi:hypothetical protein